MSAYSAFTALPPRRFQAANWAQPALPGVAVLAEADADAESAAAA